MLDFTRAIVYNKWHRAGVLELADEADSKSVAARRVGSSPTTGTIASVLTAFEGLLRTLAFFTPFPRFSSVCRQADRCMGNHMGMGKNDPLFNIEKRGNERSRVFAIGFTRRLHRGGGDGGHRRHRR